jgi:hypothetical protein
MGGPAVSEPMVEKLIAQQKGKVRFDWHAQGLSCDIALLTLAGW